MSNNRSDAAATPRRIASRRSRADRIAIASRSRAENEKTLVQRRVRSTIAPSAAEGASTCGASECSASDDIVGQNLRSDGTLGVEGIEGDLNDDGEVNGADLGILLAAWGDCPKKGACPADLNGDGEVNGADLGILLANWG